MVFQHPWHEFVPGDLVVSVKFKPQLYEKKKYFGFYAVLGVLTE